MPSRFVGRFRVEHTLGVGMFAKVLLGIDDITGERYALKVMRKDALESLDMAKYARREAFVLRRLDHPNVIPLVEAVQSDKKLFLVMPVAPGAELLSLVADGPLPEADARPYIRQLVDAVGYCHLRGVCHRDLKPENVIVDRETESLQLIDFGLTGFVEPDSLMRTTCGTAFYSAPEVTYGNGEGYSGTAADAWSVGVLSYILLTGAHPFVSADGELMEDDLKRCLLQLPESLSSGAGNFLARLIVASPGERYSMAQASLHPWLTCTTGEPEAGRSGLALQYVASESQLRTTEPVLLPSDDRLDLGPLDGLHGHRSEKFSGTGQRDLQPSSSSSERPRTLNGSPARRSPSSIFSRRESYRSSWEKQQGDSVMENVVETASAVQSSFSQGHERRLFMRGRQSGAMRPLRRRSLDGEASGERREVHPLPRVGFGRTRVTLSEGEPQAAANRRVVRKERPNHIGSWWARMRVTGQL